MKKVASKFQVNVLFSAKDKLKGICEAVKKRLLNSCQNKKECNVKHSFFSAESTKKAHRDRNETGATSN